jgi:uncharacterized membrane protein
MSTNTGGAPSAWSGWIVFAAVIMFIIGCINMIQGLAALLKHTVYVLPNSGLLVSTSYTTWGWVLIFWGIIMATAAYGLFSGSQVARWFSVLLVAINLLGQFAWFPAFPLWGLIVIALDVAVLFALTARWHEVQADFHG